MLAELVAQGELPPVEERLPENPYVAESLDGIGNYGGSMRKGFRGQGDHGTIRYIVYRGLLNVNHHLVLHPYMAESWEISDDATQFTFHLRKGTKWSDGVPITSGDFRYYYEDDILNRELTRSHPEVLSSVIEGERVPAEFSTDDDFTVSYTFRQPKALFHYWSGITREIPASPAHYLKQFHKKYADPDTLSTMVADAQLDDWTQLYEDRQLYRLNTELPVYFPWVPKNPWTDDFVRYERNPYFWEVDPAGNQLPYLDDVTLMVFTDVEVAVLRAVNGEYDCQSRHIYDFSNYTTLKEGETVGDYSVQLWPSADVWGLHFNLTIKDPRLRSLFQQRDFRTAVSLALNRDEMRELLYDGYGTNTQYVPYKTSPLYYEKLAKAHLAYDPDQANALLDGLGYTERDSKGYRLWNDGSGDRITWTVLGGGGHITAGEDFNLMLIDYLRQVGFDVNFRGVDRSLFTELTRSNEAELTTSPMDRNLIPLADPVIWVGLISDRPWSNAWRAWYQDPTDPIAEMPPEDHWIWDIWALWEEIQRTADEQKQKELFWSILDIWAVELPSIGCFGELPRVMVVKNGFKGVHEGYPHAGGITKYEYLIDDATWFWDDPEQHKA